MKIILTPNSAKDVLNYCINNTQKDLTKLTFNLHSKEVNKYVGVLFTLSLSYFY